MHGRHNLRKSQNSLIELLQIFIIDLLIYISKN